MRKFGALRERIKLIYGTQQEFADAMGVDYSTLNKKLNSKADWTSTEIEKACALLGITMNEVQQYFFY